MVKLKTSKNKKEISNNKPKKLNKELLSFLRQIKNNIKKIKLTKKEKYSLLSCIFLCFFENKKNILDKKEIYAFVKKEINENNDKIITTRKSEKGIVTIKNYCKKLGRALAKNKSFTKIVNVDSNSEEQFQINEEYILARKNTIFKHLFRDSIKIKNKACRKFRKSLSCVKFTYSKNNNEKNKKKESNINYEKEDSLIDSHESMNFSFIESKMNKTKDEESNDSGRIQDNIKYDRKKKDYLIKNKFLNQKRKSISDISSNEQSLVMPLFAGDCYNEKESQKVNIIINNDDNYEENEEIISTSLKEINIINEKAEEFIFLIKGQKFIDILKNKKKKYLKFIGSYLITYKDDSFLNNFLKDALADYKKFSKYLEYFMHNKNESFDWGEEFLKSYHKEFDISENFEIKKVNCFILINRISTKLYQFLMEYDFIVEVIKVISENHKRSIILKEIISFIEANKNVLAKNNISHLEKLLKIELENATKFYFSNMEL